MNMTENCYNYERLRSSSSDTLDMGGMKQIELDFISECINPPPP